MDSDEESIAVKDQSFRNQTVVPKMSIFTLADSRSARELKWNNTDSSVSMYFQDLVRNYINLEDAENKVRGSVQFLICEMIMKGGSSDVLTWREKVNIKTKFIRYQPVVMHILHILQTTLPCIFSNINSLLLHIAAMFSSMRGSRMMGN